MKVPQLAIRFVILFLVAVGGCAPAPAPGTPTPSLVPVALTGPQMTVSSTWLYANGSMLVAVPAGLFTMGGGQSDSPLHTVNLPGFWIFSTEVTNSQYAYCLVLGGCTSPAARENPSFDDYLHANDPVVGVDYAQASAYCSFVRARLPTEAEWEKAARGPDANTYPWGDEPPICELSNFADCVGRATPVNGYPEGRSYYGAFDMAGNVLEWVADWYQADYYTQAPADNPLGAEDGTNRSVRSSAFNSGKEQVPAFTRSFSRPETQRANLGFRCVVDDAEVFAPFCQYPAVYEPEGVGGAPGEVRMEVTCPELTIEQNAFCNGGTPVTVFKTSATRNGQPINFGLSIPNGCNKITYTSFSCSQPGQIKVCSECRVVRHTPPQCPVGYNYDTVVRGCVGQATAGVCLPGYTLLGSSGGSCCMLEPGTPAPTVGPASLGWTLGGRPDANCPPGTWHFPGEPPPGSTIPGPGECLPVPVQSPFCKTEDLYLRACATGGGDDGCPITEQSCANTCAPLGYIYDPAACTCNCNAG